jgi:hypothetical protein
MLTICLLLSGQLPVFVPEKSALATFLLLGGCSCSQILNLRADQREVTIALPKVLFPSPSIDERLAKNWIMTPYETLLLG